MGEQAKLFDVPITGSPAKKIRKPPANVVKVNHTIANKRYYYRRLLKDKYPMDTTKRVIEVPYQRFDEIPKPDRFYIGQLIKFGYNMQFKLSVPCRIIKQS